MGDIYKFYQNKHMKNDKYIEIKDPKFTGKNGKELKGGIQAYISGEGNSELFLNRKEVFLIPIQPKMTDEEQIKIIQDFNKLSEEGKLSEEDNKLIMDIFTSYSTAEDGSFHFDKLPLEKQRIIQGLFAKKLGQTLPKGHYVVRYSMHTNENNNSNDTVSLNNLNGLPSDKELQDVQEKIRELEKLQKSERLIRVLKIFKNNFDTSTAKWLETNYPGLEIKAGPKICMGMNIMALTSIGNIYVDKIIQSINIDNSYTKERIEKEINQEKRKLVDLEKILFDRINSVTTPKKGGTRRKRRA